MTTRRCPHGRRLDDWCPECEIEERDDIIKRHEAELKRLRADMRTIRDFIASRYYEGDAEYQVVLIADQALGKGGNDGE